MPVTGRSQILTLVIFSPLIGALALLLARRGDNSGVRGGALFFSLVTLALTVVALFFFSWAGSIASNLLKLTGLTKVDLDIDFFDGIPEITTLGFQAYMPDILGCWCWPLLISFGVLLVWYLFTRYNESTEKFTLF